MGESGDTTWKRVWCDGCYDMVHFGHANSLRQARALGDYLVVGVHSDTDINCHKGPTVFTAPERVKMLCGLKWVDEVVADVPYITTLATLDKYDCDFCAHGEDITTTVDGVDAYHEVKAAGRYREIHRTPGVSTTDVVNRILRLDAKPASVQKKGEFFESFTDEFLSVHKFLVNGCEMTSLKIFPSLTEITQPLNPQKVVYVTGAFDLFHVGHLDFLHKAAAQGHYLLVGLHSDAEVSRRKGERFPIMSQWERALSLLACKYVSEVVLGAPYTITTSFMRYFCIDLVCHGLTSGEEGDDPFQVPKELGKFLLVDSGNKMSTEEIVRRVLERRFEFEERNRKKEAKEKQEGVSEISVM